MRIDKPQRLQMIPEALVWILAVSMLTFRLYPLLGNQILPGWDLSSHYYLVTKMEAYLLSGKTSGYDPLWNAGTPLFSLYAPLFYILVAGAHRALRGVFTTLEVYNAYVFALPFVFLFLVRWACSRLAPRSSIPFALISALFFLFLPPWHSGLGLGLVGLVHIGFVPQFTGLCFFVAMLGALGNTPGACTIFMSVVAGVLLGCTLLSHFLTALVAIGTVILFLAFVRPGWTKACIVVISAFLVAGWYYIPLMKVLWLSSAANVVGVPLGASVSSLFPGLNAYDLGRLFDVPNWTIGEYEGDKILSPAQYILMYAPYGGLFLLAGSLVGSYALLTAGFLFLPVTFLVSIIVFLGELLPFFGINGVHPYRFVSAVWMINIFIAAIGWERIFTRVSAFSFNAARSLTSGALTGAIALGLAMTVLFQFKFENYWRSEAVGVWTRGLKQSDYPASADAENMLVYLGELARAGTLTGRVAVETTRLDASRIGALQYFNALLPLRYNIPVLPALLIESSLTSQFVTPTLAVHSEHNNWGRTVLSSQETFTNQSAESMVDRLRHFGVQYILAASGEYAANLSLVPSVQRIHSSGDYTLFDLGSFRPLATISPLKPFLFIDDGGGIDFRSFAEQWYKDTSLLERPVFYTKKRFGDLSAYEREQFGGVILNRDARVPLAASDYQPYLSVGKQVIVLNSGPVDQSKLPPGVLPIQRFDETSGFISLRDAMVTIPPPEWKPIPLSANSEVISFEGQGTVLIGYSYFPRWEASDPNQTVFLATPSFMAVFARGKTSLRYR